MKTGEDRGRMRQRKTRKKGKKGKKGSEYDFTRYMMLENILLKCIVHSF